MATRYIWRKNGVEYEMPTNMQQTSNENTVTSMRYIPQSTFSGSSAVIDQPYAYTGYKLDTKTGIISGTGSSKKLTYNTDMGSAADVKSSISGWQYRYLISPDGKYIWYPRDSDLNYSGTYTAYWTYFRTGKNPNNDNIPTSAVSSICLSGIFNNTPADSYWARTFLRAKVQGPYANPSDNQGYVTNSSSIKYPNGDVSGNVYYTLIGSDSPEPTAISYPNKDLEPGQQITISITKSTNIDSTVPVKYVYQYSIDGGSKWTTISTTTATSVTFTIPATADQIRFRVQTKDDVGWTSASYVTGTNVQMETFKAYYFDTSGIARKVSKAYYFDANGIARQVTKGYYFDENGIARRIG